MSPSFSGVDAGRGIESMGEARKKEATADAVVALGETRRVSVKMSGLERGRRVARSTGIARGARRSTSQSRYLLVSIERASRRNNKPINYRVRSYQAEKPLAPPVNLCSRLVAPMICLYACYTGYVENEIFFEANDSMGAYDYNE